MAKIYIRNYMHPKDFFLSVKILYHPTDTSLIVKLCEIKIYFNVFTILYIFCKFKNISLRYRKCFHDFYDYFITS